MLIPYREKFLSIREKGEFLVIWKSQATDIKSGIQLMMTMEDAIREKLKEKFGASAYYGKKSLVAAAQDAVNDSSINWDELFTNQTYALYEEYGSVDDFREEVNAGNLKAANVVARIQELCKTAHAHGALFHTDAVQAVGHVKINVHELEVDFLSASAHKFNGPKGIGFLYVRKGIELLPYADGGAQESAHRAGTENVASIVGMATALKANCDFLKQHQQHILELENTLIAGLNSAGISYCRNGRGTTLPGLISLSFLGKDGEAILHRMDLMGISISTGSACDSVNTETSHVLQAIRLDDNYAKGTIRVSLGKNNTKEDAEKIAAALVKIVG